MNTNSSCKLIISTKVEQKISICCRELPHNEWSGTLFYRVQSGSFGNNLVLIADDLFLRDVGSSTYTEFDDDVDAFNYQIENGLEDDIQGLCHSHNQMASFFSGVDSSTLEEFGKLMPHFLSLIVNNKGNYCAKITRRIPVANHYLTFNGEEAEYQGDECIVQSFPVEIVFQDESIISETKAKLKELQSKKSSFIRDSKDSDNDYPTLWNDNFIAPNKASELLSYPYNNSSNKTKQAKEAPKKENKEVKITKENNKKSTTKQVVENKESLETFIQKKIKSLLFGSCIFTVSKDFDVKDWCKNKMEKAFENNFIDYSTRNNWISTCLDNLVALCIDKYDDIEDINVIEDTITTYLDSLPKNKYIKEIKDCLTEIMYEYII